MDIKTAKSIVEAAMRPVYPMDDGSGWYSDGDYEARGGRMTAMSPDDYLAQVRPLDLDDESRESIDILKDHILGGGRLDPLKIYADGKEDGRHRAHAARELGITEVPVIDFRSGPVEEGVDHEEGDWFRGAFVLPVSAVASLQGASDRAGDDKRHREMVGQLALEPQKVPILVGRSHKQANDPQVVAFDGNRRLAALRQIGKRNVVCVNARVDGAVPLTRQEIYDLNGRTIIDRAFSDAEYLKFTGQTRH